MKADFTSAFLSLCRQWGVEDLDEVPYEKIKALPPDEYKRFIYEKIMRHGRLHATDRGVARQKPRCARCNDKGSYRDAGRVRHCPCRWPDRLQHIQRAANLPDAFSQFSIAGFETDSRDRQEARKQALEFAEEFRGWRAGGNPSPKGMWLHGAPGARKTTLACSVANSVISGGSREVFFFEWHELNLWVQLAIRGASGLQLEILPHYIKDAVELKSGEAGVLALLYTVPLLILDDLAWGKNLDSGVKWLSQLLYARNKVAKPTIVTTNLTETEVTQVLEPRLQSRIRSYFHWLPLAPVDGRLGGRFGKARAS